MKRKLLAALLWLGIWQLASLAIRNEILLAGPWDCLKALWAMLQQGEFYESLLFTGLRVFGGLLVGCVLGLLMAWLAWRFRLLRSFFAPPLTVMKTAPVVSFVLLLLIWRGAAFLSFAISLIVVLPIVYLNTLSGLDAMDPKLRELARVFRIPFWRQWRIYYHALFSEWRSALQLAVGMGWKSGIAAEVIGQPLRSIGNGLYRSKIYLDTAGVLAWTVVAVLLSLLMEKLLLFAFSRLRREHFRKKPRTAPAASLPEPVVPFTLRLDAISKRYGDKQLFHGLDAELRSGQWYWIRGASGIGKTTLFRILMGLETPDDGCVSCDRALRFSAVFQEDRLLPEYSARRNVAIAAGNAKDAQAFADLSLLLGEDAAQQACAELSGGMCRRVSTVCACLSASDVLILDEPFTGLDRENQLRTLEYLRSHSGGRLVLIAAHDSDLLDFCEPIDLETPHEAC